MPKQGVASTFSFGTSFGKLIGMCQTLGVRFDLVLPQIWKRDILQGTKKDKGASIDYVSRVYPEVNLIPGKCRKYHDGIADAVCMMLWGLRKYG